MNRAPAIFILMILLISAGLAALQVGRASLERLATWPSAPAGVTLDDTKPTSPGTAPNHGAGPRAPRLLIILVDGLSVADSLRLPSVERLGRKGAFYEARVPEPAWPVSAWATALSGRAPAGHGLWLPDHPRSLPLPNLPALANAHGVEVALAGGPTFLPLGELWATGRTYRIPPGWEGTGDAVLKAGTSALRSGADLVILHLEGLHTVAHRLQGDRSVEPPAPEGDGPRRVPPTVPWDDGLAWTDVRLAQILDAVDLERTNVIVAGSYGATASGRHGAGRAVPLVLAGPQVRAGVRDKADLRDLAPTAAALLGLPQALAPEGRVLAGALGQEPAQTSAQAPRPFSWQELWQNLSPRLPWLGISLLLVVLYGWATARQPFGEAAWRAILVYLAVNELVFFMLGGRYSADQPGLENLGRSFWLQRGLEALVAMGAAALTLGWRLARQGVPVPVRRPRGARAKVNAAKANGPVERRPPRPAYVAVAALHATLLAALLLGLAVFGVLLYTGWEVPRFPGVPWAVYYFINLSRIAAVTFLAPVWAIAAAISGLAARSLYPPEEAPVAAEAYPTTGMPVQRGSVVSLEGRRPRDQSR